MSSLFQTPAVKRLLGWRRGDEEEKWAERAIEGIGLLHARLVKTILEQIESVPSSGEKIKEEKRCD